MSHVDRVIEQRRRDLGGFEVGRVLPQAGAQMVGPFIFFDHMGPVDFSAGIPRAIDVRPHPHIGLSTVTYLFAGEIMHRDSVGSEQAIRPGEVNWMTAGRGITHSERFERARSEGGETHGIQAWVALPDGEEEAEPAFTHHAADALPLHQDKGVTGRLIAGELLGARSPVKTHSPMFYAHWELEAHARCDVPAEHPERAIYVARGAIDIDHQSHRAGRMLVLASGTPVRIEARAPTTLLLLGGDPVGRRYIEWNFVASSLDRIEAAKADWRAGRMKLPDLDDEEFIPLPEDSSAQAVE